LQAASRLRRRLLAASFLVLGSVILLVPAEFMSPSMRWKGLLLAPAFLSLGLTGLLFPRSVPDPYPPGGAVSAVAEAGSTGLVIGACAFFIGLGIGVWQVLSG
jgi:hypothetical protein